LTQVLGFGHHPGLADILTRGLAAADADQLIEHRVAGLLVGEPWNPEEPVAFPRRPLFVTQEGCSHCSTRFPSLSTGNCRLGSLAGTSAVGGPSAGSPCSTAAPS